LYSHINDVSYFRKNQTKTVAVAIWKMSDYIHPSISHLL